MTDSSNSHYRKLDALFAAVQSARIERDKSVFDGSFNTLTPKFDYLIEILRYSDALDILEKEIAL